MIASARFEKCLTHNFESRRASECLLLGRRALGRARAMGGPRVGDRSALTSRCQGVVSRPLPGGREGRNSSEKNAPGSASSKPSCLRSNSEFFPHGPNHLITSSSHTGRTTRSPLSLSPPLPPLSVAAVAVVVATIAVVTVVARAAATVAAAVATVHCGDHCIIHRITR